MSKATKKLGVETLTDVVSKLEHIRGVSYTFIDEKYGSGPQVGVIAQELQQVFPELVVQMENGYLGVDYLHLSGVLVQAIKEQQKEIEDLKTQMQNQQHQINEIIKKLK